MNYASRTRNIAYPATAFLFFVLEFWKIFMFLLDFQNFWKENMNIIEL